ncbi:class F sortase [Nocardioides sp. BP30]|uniref:class F sortase n=1 Tax=Nocardioides sp. BP30 TaxID=3036374 RepID=UPI0024689F36|nr:class F sortase [Nocardioides sp. BP30]WGL51924.1 class F sortase [Nocardioides sp. BP30]
MTEVEPTPAGPGSPPPARTRVRWGSVAVATVLALLAAAFLFLLISPDRDEAAPADRGTTTAFKPTTYHVVVHSLGIDAPIVSIAMSSRRVLTPPSNPRDVGWWDASAKPGSATGQTIIAGHTVHTGGGEFDHLGTMKKGARIEIVRKRRTDHYVATKVFTLSKQQVSARARQLFGQDRAKNRLVLITCGDWTGHEYLTNVFVYAKPVRSAHTVPQPG